MTTSDSELQKVVQQVTKSSTTSKKGTVYFKEWMIAILYITKIDPLLEGMDS